MNSKIFSALAAVAIALAITPSSFAAKLSPGQFTAGVKAAVGTKTGTAAYKAAAKYFKAALSDKNNKKNVIAYTTSVIAVLKKPVASSLQIKARASLADALTQGYFKGIAYTPQDAKFATALSKLVKTLPASLKTLTAAQTIAAAVLKKGGGAADINFINDTVYNAAGQKPPTPVS
jgi:F0F1-type ATP synthase alpha subunit